MRAFCKSQLGIGAGRCHTYGSYLFGFDILCGDQARGNVVHSRPLPCRSALGVFAPHRISKGALGNRCELALRPCARDLELRLFGKRRRPSSVCCFRAGPAVYVARVGRRPPAFCADLGNCPAFLGSVAAAGLRKQASPCGRRLEPCLGVLRTRRLGHVWGFLEPSVRFLEPFVGF